MIDERLTNVHELTVSQRGRVFIKRWEGLSLEAYADCAGNRTVGYGHKLASTQIHVITQEQADYFFSLDVSGVIAAIRGTVHVRLNQNMFDALADWIFNLGSSDWIPRAALLALNKGEYQTAIFHMALYDRAGHQYVRGLHDRRLAEVDLWQSRL